MLEAMFMFFSPNLGVPCWGRGARVVSRKELVHNLRVQFFTLGTSKIEVLESWFFDIVSTK